VETRNYWLYSYEPPQVPYTEEEWLTRSIEYWQIGQTELGKKVYQVLFTTYQFEDQALVPSLSVTLENTLWDGGLIPEITMPLPLAVGQTQTRVQELEGQAITLTAHVLAVESQVVPAGVLQTFHVQYLENGQPYADLWYSTEIEGFVKRISSVSPIAQRLQLVTHGIIAGTLILNQDSQFSSQTALDRMFDKLRQIAQHRPDLVLAVLQKLIDWSIATQEAKALMNQLLSSTK
jgi:hypothetical protein